MKVEINLDRWYAKGNVNTPYGYHVLLQNNQGERCCLGFCALQHGATEADIIGIGMPAFIRRNLNPYWMLDAIMSHSYTSDIANLAIDLNDARFEWESQPLEVRMGNLITVFAEGGDELLFNRGKL